VTGYLDLSTSMTFNDLEPSQKGFLVNFSQYLDAAHTSILNCDEMAGVRPRQPAYEIFSIKRRFPQSKSWPPRFMEPGAGGRQRLQRFRAAQVYIIHNVAPRYWRWWRGVIGNAFRLKRSYSTPGLVSTAKGDYWTGTALGFRASRELCSNFLFYFSQSVHFISFYFVFFLISVLFSLDLPLCMIFYTTCH